MKPQDIGPNYMPKLRECTNFAVRTVKDVCRNIGPRPSGSLEEEKAQQFMADRVGKAADSVEKDEFTVHNRGFFAWQRIDAVLLILATAALIFKMNIVSVIIDVVAAFLILMEFLFYVPFLDWMFPKQTSHNFILTRKPEGEVKRRFIVGGHADSSFEWRFTHLGGGKMMISVFVYAACGLGYNFLVSLIEMIVEKSVLYAPSFEPLRWWSWIGLVFIPAFIMLYIFINYKVCVEGANDNLTGCMTGAALMKFLDDNNIRFKNTEIKCVFTGSEEAGIRGSAYFGKKHKDELLDDNVETVFFALDTFRDLEDMAVYSKDLTGLVHQDKRVCNLAKKAGEKAGLELPFSSIYAGASDAASMKRAGVKSVCLSSMNPGPPKYYHTRDDRCDNMRPEAVEKALETVVEAAFMFDEQGLKENYD